MIPKSTFNVGSPVIVRCDEHPGTPFPAFVSAVWWCPKYRQHEYRVTYLDGTESDGYTDEWLTEPLAYEANLATIAGGIQAAIYATPEQRAAAHH